MGEIRIVGPGKTHGYPYPVCKNHISIALGNKNTINYRYHQLKVKLKFLISQSKFPGPRNFTLRQQ